MLKVGPLSEKNLPDIAVQSKDGIELSLDRVGMSEVELPVLLPSSDGSFIRTPAKADLFVSLDQAKSRGIHMSRLFLRAQQILESQEFNVLTFKNMLKDFIESHKDLSKTAYAKVSFELLTSRPALKTQNMGWRTYPVSLSGTLRNGVYDIEMSVSVMYSSTCPCSAALSRQLMQEHFMKSFQGKPVTPEEIHAWLGKHENIVATPHAQRSIADVKIKLEDDASETTFIEVIDMVEKALGTPVQAAVKREDEQEFARLNAANLMFCEDAARKLSLVLRAQKTIKDFWLRVDHRESLHPHNAVSVNTKGIEGGYRA